MWDEIRIGSRRPSYLTSRLEPIEYNLNLSFIYLFVLEQAKPSSDIAIRSERLGTLLWIRADPKHCIKLSPVLVYEFESSLSLPHSRVAIQCAGDRLWLVVFLDQ